MINVTLPNGKFKKYDIPISPYEIAKDISSSLAKDALIAKVNDDLWDLNRLIQESCKITILTICIKHSCPLPDVCWTWASSDAIEESDD